MRHLRTILAVIATFLFTTLPVWADQVKTNDRVTGKLRVRKEPKSDADAIGYLKPGDSVPLVRNAGAWREVQLNGYTGYVSSAYTVVVPDSGSPAGKTYSIRVGSWNMKKLGHGSGKNYDVLAKVVEQNFDLLAVVEVMQKSGGHPGYEALMQKLGSGWTGQVTDRPRPDTSDGNAEFYAIIWRASAVRACSGWTGLRYHDDNDGGEDGRGPDIFVREPAFGCYEYGPAERPAGDFLLAAYHATFKGSSAIDAEVKQLGDVFASMKAARPGEKDLMIWGDFNRVPSQIASLLPRIADKTKGDGSTLNNGGKLTTNLYDHVLVYDPVATKELQGDAQVLQVLDVVASGQLFYKEISDHLPIMAVFKSVKDDD